MVLLFVMTLAAGMPAAPGRAVAAPGDEPARCLPGTPAPARDYLTLLGLLEELGCVPSHAFRTTTSGERWAVDGAWPRVDAVRTGSTITFSWSPPSTTELLCTVTIDDTGGGEDCAQFGDFAPRPLVASILWPATMEGNPADQFDTAPYFLPWLEQYRDLDDAATTRGWANKGTEMTLTRVGTCGVERATDRNIPNPEPPYLPRTVRPRGLTDTACTYTISGLSPPDRATNVLVAFPTVATTEGGHLATYGVSRLSPSSTHVNGGSEIEEWSHTIGCWPTACRDWKNTRLALNLVSPGLATSTMPGPEVDEDLRADFTWEQVDRSTLRFDASGSSGASFTSYTWRFGPGTANEVERITPTIDRSFVEEGILDVELIVRAPDGRTASVTKRVTLPSITVNSTGDAPGDPSREVLGICDTGAVIDDRPECTLRAAIAAANAAPGPDTIRFAIAGSGVPTIAPRSPLPAITGATVLDGSTQPAGSVALDGTAAGSGSAAVGLDLAGPPSTVRSVAVGGFAGAGIRLAGAGSGGHVVADSKVGVGPDGVTARPNGAGIDVVRADSVVGGAGDGNLVSGNRDVGIRVAADRVHVSHNQIGTDASGTVAVPNAFGVVVAGGADVRFGPDNRVAGNAVGGVLAESYEGPITALHVTDNVIGLGAVDEPLPQAVGVAISDGAAERPVRGTVVTGNTISSNAVDVSVVGGATSDTTLAFNRVGTTESGADLGPRAPGTRLAGIRIDGAQGTAVRNNTVVGHGIAEVAVFGRDEVTTTDPLLDGPRFNWPGSRTRGGPVTGAGTVVSGNTIGTLAGGGRTDTVVGVLLAFRADDVTIGPDNQIGHASVAGIMADDVTDLTVVANVVGATPSGAPAPNRVGLLGVGIERAQIGRAGQGNRFVHNTDAGVLLRGDADVEGLVTAGGGLTRSVTVAGNTVTDSVVGIGVFDGTVDTTVGGAASGAGNVVTDTTGAGLYVVDDDGYPFSATPTNTRVVGNRIGIDAAGRPVSSHPLGVGVGASLGTELVANQVHGRDHAVRVADGVDALLSQNEVWGAATSNLALDGSANGGIAAPVIDAVTTDGSRTRVVLPSLAGGPHRLELFVNGACAPGPPEARDFLGAVQVAEGETTIELPTAVDPGAGITATITSSDGRTSELSACRVVALPPHVRILRGPNGERIVLTAPEGTRFTYARSIDNPAPDTAPRGVRFPFGFIEFQVAGVAPGAEVVVEIDLPDGVDLDAYWRYGPTGDGSAGWYDFTRSAGAGPGAQLLDGKVLLHLRDGGVGDDDGRADGVITDPGGPAQLEPPTTQPVPSTVPTASARQAVPSSTVSPTAPPSSSAHAGVLPRTGAAAGGTVGLAVVLLSMGALLTAASCRWRSPTRRPTARPATPGRTPRGRWRRAR